MEPNLSTERRKTFWRGTKSLRVARKSLIGEWLICLLREERVRELLEKHRYVENCEEEI